MKSWSLPINWIPIKEVHLCLTSFIGTILHQWVWLCITTYNDSPITGAFSFFSCSYMYFSSCQDFPWEISLSISIWRCNSSFSDFRCSSADSRLSLSLSHSINYIMISQNSYTLPFSLSSNWLLLVLSALTTGLSSNVMIVNIIAILNAILVL